MPQHLGIDVEKNISTETEKRLLSQSHSHVFRENVNIIGVHLRYVVVQLVQGIQQRSQVCLEDHQTSEKNPPFLTMGWETCRKVQGKMIETLGG